MSMRADVMADTIWRVSLVRDTQASACHRSHFKPVMLMISPCPLKKSVDADTIKRCTLFFLVVSVRSVSAVLPDYTGVRRQLCFNISTIYMPVNFSASSVCRSKSQDLVQDRHVKKHLSIITHLFLMIQ